MIVQIIEQSLKARLAVIGVTAQLAFQHGVAAIGHIIAAFFVAKLLAVKQLGQLLQGLGRHFRCHFNLILLGMVITLFATFAFSKRFAE